MIATDKITPTNSNSLANGMGSKSDIPQTETVRKDLENLWAEIKAIPNEQLPDLRDRLRRAVSESSFSGSGIYREAANVARDLRAFAEAGASRARDTTEGFIKENPWRSVAIIGGVGLVIGALLARRR